jgi:hypothetical protein
MKGRARGTRVKDFDSLIGSITGDYSQEQKQLLSFLRAAGFGELQILRPSSEYPSDTGLLIDLEMQQGGRMQFAPELMRAFLALSHQLKYGLIIGANAPVLRIDMSKTNYARAIGFDGGKQRTNRDPLYAETLRNLQTHAYKYTGDGDLNWSQFWKQAEADAERKSWLELVNDTSANAKSVARYALFGAGLYLLNKLAPFAQLAGMIVQASKKKSRKKRR